MKYFKGSLAPFLHAAPWAVRVGGFFGFCLAYVPKWVASSRCTPHYWGELLAPRMRFLTFFPLRTLLTFVWKSLSVAPVTL
jgi:hypothetical protein